MQPQKPDKNKIDEKTGLSLYEVKCVCLCVSKPHLSIKFLGHLFLHQKRRKNNLAFFNPILSLHDLIVSKFKLAFEFDVLQVMHTNP